MISSERLDLVALSPAFLRASLLGDRAAAEDLLGVRMPSEWFQRRATIEMRLDQLERNPALRPWLLRATVLRAEGVVVGHIGFHTGPDPDYLADLAPGGIELGYSIYPPFRRRGYAREAATALMGWAAAQHGLTRFVVSIRPDNIPSQRLAQEFGFRRIGSHLDLIDGEEDILLLVVKDDR